MTESLPPNLHYYTLCVGRWACQLDFRLRSVAALMAAPLAIPVKLSLLSMALMMRFGLRPQLRTSVEIRDEVHVIHTTGTWLFGIELMQSVEDIALDPDGRRATISGSQTLWPFRFWKIPVSGTIEIDENYSRAAYALTWLGDALDQRATREGDLVVLEQRTGWFEGVQSLRRLPAAV